jgi:hypothetical protein
VSLSRDRLVINRLTVRYRFGSVSGTAYNKSMSEVGRIWKHPLSKPSPTSCRDRRWLVETTSHPILINCIMYEGVHKHRDRFTPLVRNLPPSNCIDRLRSKQPSLSKQLSRSRGNYETPICNRSVSVTQKANPPLEETALKSVHLEYENTNQWK